MSWFQLSGFADNDLPNRPQESLQVIGDYVDAKNARWIFPPMKSKGKKSPRIIYLNDAAMAISTRLNEEFREGDPLTVALLMGHKDPSNLARVYQHLSHSPDHMREQAGKQHASRYD